MTYHDPEERKALIDFVMNHGRHELTVLHDHDSYRHLRIGRRDTRSWQYELMVTPGRLTYWGDNGDQTLTFQTGGNPMAFFRGPRLGDVRGHYINVDYWAQKLPRGGRDVFVYDPDHGRQRAEYEIAEYATESYPDLREEYEHRVKLWQDSDSRDVGLRGPRPRRPTSPQELRDDLNAAWSTGRLAHEEGLRGLLDDWETLGVVSDVWEMDLRTPAFWYLRALHQIVAAIHLWYGDEVDYSGWELVRGVARRVGERRRRGGFPRHATITAGGRMRPVETVPGL